LGAATDDVVAALIQVANHSQLAERRTRARKLLDQPSPIFSRSDVQKILEPLSARSNPRVSEDTVAALQKVLTESAPDGFNPGEELRPDQLRRILSAIGQTDPALRDALLAAAQAVDPNFRSE
jgi:hypothetical protein